MTPPPHPTGMAAAAAIAAHHVARPIIRQAFAADSCVASTRIVIDALAAFGVAAKPVPVHARVFNAAMVQLLTDTATTDATAVAAAAGGTAQSVGGPWWIDLGGPREQPSAGHVVVGVPLVELMLDLSIDQANRPHKDIDLAPILWSVDGRLFSEVGWSEQRQLDSGVLVAYQRVAGHPYRISVNWHRRAADGVGRGLFRDITGQVITAMRAYLEAATT